MVLVKLLAIVRRQRGGIETRVREATAFSLHTTYGDTDKIPHSRHFQHITMDLYELHSRCRSVLGVEASRAGMNLTYLAYTETIDTWTGANG